jgi:hypothetical protein
VQVVDAVDGKPSKTLVKILKYDELSQPVEVETKELIYSRLYPNSGVIPGSLLSSTVHRFSTSTVTTVELSPVTGRTHQLRMHMAYLGHPLLGDSLYAPASVITVYESKRLHLHANSITFTHPFTNEQLTISTNGVDFDLPVITMSFQQFLPAASTAAGMDDESARADAATDSPSKSLDSNDEADERPRKLAKSSDST